MLASPKLAPVLAPALAAAILLALGTAAARAQTVRAPAPASDTTLDSAQRLVRKAYLAARDNPLSQNADAGQVIAALRSSGDKDLLSFFQKLRSSKVVDNQLFAMTAAAILAKQAGVGGGDPESQAANFVDVPLLLSSKDSDLIGSALASLIDVQALSVAQLNQLLAKAPEASHRAMVAGELARLQKLDDRSILQTLLKDDKFIVRYYAAATMLARSPAEQKPALDAMKTMTETHNLKQAPIQALMLVRMQKENLSAGTPWAAQIAADEQCDEGLRYTALATLLSFQDPQGPGILADMIQKQKDAIQQVKLGLISIEYAAQLKPAILDPLLSSKSTLAKSIATIARKATTGGDITPDLVALLKEGHPIVLDWALAYSDRTDADRSLAIRSAVISQATIVDDVRDRDYERAALAAQKILDGENYSSASATTKTGAQTSFSGAPTSFPAASTSFSGAPASVIGASSSNVGRKTIANFLKSENRAVVEATLAGILRSKAKNQSELISPAVWEGLTKTTSLESATNYAALILAREGRKEALVWLPGMVMGGTSQGAGFRALAGWYYAKLQGRADTFLKAALAD